MTPNAKPMNPARLKQVITVAVLVTGIVVAWMSWTLFHSYQLARVELPRALRMEELRGKLFWFDELKTMAARAGAATGDPHWEERYKEILAELDRCLEESQRLQKDDPRAPDSATYMAADDKMDATDAQAFALIHEGRLKEAQALLTDSEYKKQEKIYSDGLEELGNWLKQTANTEVAQLQQQVRLSIVVAISGMLILLICWGYILIVMRRWQATLLQTNLRLNEQSTQLQEFSHQLDGKVAERTKQLRNSEIALLNMMDDTVRSRGNVQRALDDLKLQVAERTKAEDSMRKSDERFRSCFELGLIGMAITSPTKGCLEVNDELCRILGYERAEMLQKPWTEMTHPDDLVADVVQFNRVIAGEIDGYTLEKRWNRKDGRVIDTTISTKCLRRADGSVDYFVALLQDITERKQALAALQSSEARTKAIVQSSLDCIVAIDHGGRILEFNPAAERVFGHMRADVLGKELAQIMIPPKLRERHRQGMMRYLATGETHVIGKRIEISAIRSDGGEFPIELAITRMGTETPPTFTGFIRDISEHKRAARQLSVQHLFSRVLAESATLKQASVRILQTVCENLNWDVGEFWSVDHKASLLRFDEIWSVPGLPTDDFMTVSSALTFERGVGLPGRAWMEGKPIWIPDVGMDANFPRMAVAKLAGLHSAFAFPIRAGNEVIGVVEFFSREMRQPDEETLQMFTFLGSQLGQFLERKRGEETLRESNEKFNQLAENINEVFWIVNPADGKILYVSPAYEKIWGRSCESLYKSPEEWLEAIHPEDREKVRQAITTKMQDRGGEYDETYRILRPDGALRWIHDRGYPLRNSAGKIFRMVGTASDITANQNLEAQFRQSQKMEAFGLLAGGIAHDFNNLMSVVMGYSDIWLMKLPADAPIRGPLKAIRNAGERAADLTKQLLAFSRKTVLEPKVLDLNAVVRETEKMLKRLIGEDIQLTSILNPAIRRIKVDPGQIGQVLINLAVNARDAMPRGGNLTVQTGTADFDDAYVLSHPGAQPGHQVTLSVSDTGTGMPPETVARIFEPFFTTKEVGKGTGLGLAVVHGVVTQSGGSIQVDSVVGAGTTFRLCFPVTSDAIQRVGKSGEIILHAGIESILVVEDEDSLRDIVAESLRLLGYNVLAARSGPEALELLSRHKGTIDLLLTDVVMPGMSGRELAEVLKETLPSLKVLFMSGYTDDSVVRHGIHHEKVAFLQKPFVPFDLLKKVREVLDAPNSTIPPAAKPVRPAA